MIWRSRRPLRWGGRALTIFTVTVFVVLSSLDHAALGVPLPLIPVISEDLSVSEASIGFVTALSIFIVGFASVGWGFGGWPGWPQEASFLRHLYLVLCVPLCRGVRVVHSVPNL